MSATFARAVAIVCSRKKSAKNHWISWHCPFKIRSKCQEPFSHLIVMLTSCQHKTWCTFLHDSEWKSQIWLTLCHFDFKSGSTYTRWGHASCPSTADLVYKGSMAGSHYAQKGAGANHLCLPFDPEYVPGVGNGGGAYIYGSEYRHANQINSDKHNIQLRNIPCAVCRVQMRSTTIMVPAHNSCPRSWTREYYGFLMGAHYTYRKMNYICMDREMKTLPGHAGDQGGNLLYSAATQCGHGLDCPPYQAEKPITCAVCTT